MGRPLVLGLAVTAALMAATPAAARERTYTLRSHALPLAGYQVAFGRESIPRPHVTGYVTRMHSRLVDAHGRYVPPWRVMLHHIVFANTAHKDPICPRLSGERFYGTGEEDQELRLPAGYGYFTRRSDKWRDAWMVMNHHAGGDRVWIETKVTMVSRRRLAPVRPYWVGVTRCLADPIFNVPGGGAAGFTKSRDWVVPRNGRIVEAGSHVHGGDRSLRLTEPTCGNRTLIDSQPQYGTPDHPIYQIYPLLHEPGPLSTSSQSTASGIPVRKGTRLRISAAYDDSHLHTRVMGIMHVYMARAHGRPAACGPLPRDLVTRRTNTLARPGVATVADPPRVDVPLAALDRAGRAHEFAQMPGDPVSLGANPLLAVANFAFKSPNVVVSPGARVTWAFRDTTAHDATVTAGPRGFASPPSRRGDRYSVRLTVPGTYSVLCTRHPVTMHETIVVR